MRPFLLATLLALAAFILSAHAQIGGVRGVVDKKLEGVGDYNQSIEDAMNGTDNKPKTPPPPAAGELKTGWLTRKSADGKSIRLYFAYPANLTKAKPAAGLIVLQEWWGVNDDMQERTRDFAAKGFYAVAPDLYNNKVTDDPAEAQKLKDAMTDAYALTAMKTGLDLLQEETRNGVVDAKRVGAVGWCMGGQQSLLLSLADTRVKATALFYGPLVTDAIKLKGLQGPVLGIFGNDDKAPSPDDVKKWQDALKAAGKTDVTVYQYDGVGHAFASKSAAKMGAYNETKAREAFDKMWSWMDAKLPR